MTIPAKHSAAEKAFQLLLDDDDGRACKDISDAACTTLPANFFLLMVSQSFTALADLISNPKTVLSWLCSALGVPPAFIAWLVQQVAPSLFCYHNKT